MAGEVGARRADSGASDSLMGSRCFCVCSVNTSDGVNSTGWLDDTDR